MKQMLVCENKVYATESDNTTPITVNTLNDLGPGSLAILTDAGVLHDATALLAAQQTALANTKAVQFFVGKSPANTYGPWSSPMITDRAGARARKVAAVAPTLPVKAIGYNGTSGSMNLPTLEADQELVIKLTNETNGTQPPKAVRSYTYTVEDGDTEAIILNALIALINADADAFVTAAANDSGGGTDGIDFTAKVANEDFTVAVSGIGKSADRSTVTALVMGKGQGDQVYALWEDLSAEYGNTNRLYLSDKYFNAANPVNAATTYTIYSIEWEEKHIGPVKPEVPSTQNLILAVEAAAATLVTQLDVTLNAIFSDLDQAI